MAVDEAQPQLQLLLMADPVPDFSVQIRLQQIFAPFRGALVKDLKVIREPTVDFASSPADVIDAPFGIGFAQVANLSAAASPSAAPSAAADPSAADPQHDWWLTMLCSAIFDRREMPPPMIERLRKTLFGSTDLQGVEILITLIRDTLNHNPHEKGCRCAVCSMGEMKPGSMVGQTTGYRLLENVLKTGFRNFKVDEWFPKMWVMRVIYCENCLEPSAVLLALHVLRDLKTMERPLMRIGQQHRADAAQYALEILLEFLETDSLPPNAWELAQMLFDIIGDARMENRTTQLAAELLMHPQFSLQGESLEDPAYTAPELVDYARGALLSALERRDVDPVWLLAFARLFRHISRINEQLEAPRAISPAELGASDQFARVVKHLKEADDMLAAHMALLHIEFPGSSRELPKAEYTDRSLDATLLPESDRAARILIAAARAALGALWARMVACAHPIVDPAAIRKALELLDGRFDRYEISEQALPGYMLQLLCAIEPGDASRPRVDPVAVVAALQKVHDSLSRVRRPIDNGVPIHMGPPRAAVRCFYQDGTVPLIHIGSTGELCPSRHTTVRGQCVCKKDHSQTDDESTEWDPDSYCAECNFRLCLPDLCEVDFREYIEEPRHPWRGHLLPRTRAKGAWSGPCVLGLVATFLTEEELPALEARPGEELPALEARPGDRVYIAFHAAMAPWHQRHIPYSLPPVFTPMMVRTIRTAALAALAAFKAIAANLSSDIDKAIDFLDGKLAGFPLDPDVRDSFMWRLLITLCGSPSAGPLCGSPSTRPLFDPLAFINAVCDINLVLSHDMVKQLMECVDVHLGSDSDADALSRLGFPYIHIFAAPGKKLRLATAGNAPALFEGTLDGLDEHAAARLVERLKSTVLRTYPPIGHIHHPGIRTFIPGSTRSLPADAAPNRLTQLMQRGCGFGNLILRGLEGPEHKAFASVDWSSRLAVRHHYNRQIVKFSPWLLTPR